MSCSSPRGTEREGDGLDNGRCLSLTVFFHMSAVWERNHLQRCFQGRLLVRYLCPLPLQRRWGSPALPCRDLAVSLHAAAVPPPFLSPRDTHRGPVGFRSDMKESVTICGASHGSSEARAYQLLARNDLYSHPGRSCDPSQASLVTWSL